MREVLFASLLAVTASCGNDNGGTNPDGGMRPDAGTPCVEASFTSIHDELLSTNTCAIAGCHGAQNSQGNLNLKAGKQAAYDALLNGGTFNDRANSQFPDRVVAGTSTASYLYVKVSQNNPPGGGSGRMPPGLPLADCDVEAIRDWIEAGAPND